MKNSPKWGQSECEFWAPSKRRHHPYTIRANAPARPPMKELLPKGKIVHIEGAGHNVRRENRAQTIDVMKAFLSGT